MVGGKKNEEEEVSLGVFMTNTEKSSIFSISFHSSTCLFSKLFTLQLGFLPYFPYHFTIFFCIFQILSLFNFIFHIISQFNLGFFHIFHIFSLFNLPFFHIFPIFSLFNLLFFCIFQIFSPFNLLFFVSYSLTYTTHSMIFPT